MHPELCAPPCVRFLLLILQWLKVNLWRPFRALVLQLWTVRLLLLLLLLLLLPVLVLPLLKCWR